MKIAVLYNTSEYLLRFRSELMKSLVDAGHEVVAITPVDSETPRLSGLNVRWLEWKLAGQAVNPIKDIESMLDLRKILIDERPDAILNFTIKPAIYGSLVASFVGVPRIVSMITGMGSLFLQGGVMRNLLLTLIKTLYRLAMRRNHSVLFQNDEDFDYFVQSRFIVREKGRRINGSGVNLELFSSRSQSVRVGSFLLISRMIKEKGIFEFIEAARKIKLIYPKAHFTLVGPIDSNPGAISLAQIRAWEREGVVDYAGVQSDVRPFLESADVYVLPTYYFEGVPRSILEALAMGKPIITTDWRGCRDTVVPNVNGFLIRPKDSDELAFAMKKFLENSSLSPVMGVESRRLAENKFNVVTVNDIVIRELTS